MNNPLSSALRSVSPPVVTGSPGAYDFPTLKKPAIASRGMVTSNHPLASHAGCEILLNGGIAVDAAAGVMFALSVVEPMMTTIFGAGFMNIRLADGTAVVIDNYAEVPRGAAPDMFEPIPDDIDHGVVDNLNTTGHLAVAVGGTLLGWATAVKKYGRLSLAEVVAPAVRMARTGFRVSPYLQSFIRETKDDLARYTDSSKVFLPGGRVPDVGDRIVRPEYGDTLEAVGRHGPDYLYHGPLGRAIAEDMTVNGGLITFEEIEEYQVYELPPLKGQVAGGYEILAPPPPSSGGAHIIQMSKILAQDDLKGMGFGTPDWVHIISEAMKIAFADRAEYMADPKTTNIPLEWLISDSYASERRAEIKMDRAGSYKPGIAVAPEANNTTTATVMDAEGNVVATTNTLHSPFGSKVTVPGTGMLLNNNMQLMDPWPGRTNSIAPGKRILSSMSPVIVERDGEPYLALGSVGGLKIFGSVFQAICNIIHHRMSLQQALEAPRLWDRGAGLEIERGFPSMDALVRELEGRGHEVTQVFKSGGGMNGLMRDADSNMILGAACWRADGVPAGFSGGDGLVESKEMGSPL
jgi:gamma-glutamyltranspeptidase/glutathione hydrolase